jgi:NAD(P)-dependent dehydrogenase (short-subunit alcohol dehydrogenase family)
MLNNKIIVITGGAGLLGQEFVKSIVQNNGTAIIADINYNLALSIQKELKTSLKRSNIDAIELDITSKKSLIKCLDYLNKTYGKIDALVNNAYPRNKNYGKDFFDVSYKDFTENLSLNLGGYFNTSQQFAKYFLMQGYGNIINISSVYGVIPPKFELYEKTSMTMPVEYAVIKSGLIHLTKYMAKYFKNSNIRVNTLSPGGIFDNQNKIFVQKYKKECLNKGMLDTSDLSGSLIYLLSDMSQYVNGQNIIVDDGFSI